MLITFSGLDGAGKSTLIRDLISFFQESGRQVTLLTMYDDISFYSFIRKLRDTAKSRLGIKIKKDNFPQVTLESEIKFSSDLRDPKATVDDKKSLSTRLIYSLIRNQMTRKLFLFLDLLVLLYYRVSVEKIKGHVLITDRYLYDSLADVADLNSLKWGFIRFFMRILPEPDVPIFVDVPAEKAYERKKEYPVEYMKWRRKTYQKILGWARDPLILHNDDLYQTIKILRQSVLKRINSNALFNP